MAKAISFAGTARSRRDFHAGEGSRSNTGRILERRRAIAAYCAIELAITVAAGVAALLILPVTFAHWRQNNLVVCLAVLVTASSLVGWSLGRGHYRKCTQHSGVVAVGTAVTACLRAASILLAVLFALRLSESLSRWSLFTFIALTLAGTLVGRAFFSLWSQRMLASNRMVCARTMILGERSQLEMARNGLNFFDRLRRDGISVVATATWADAGSEVQRRALVSTVCEKSRCGEMDSVVIMPTSSSIEFAEQLVGAFAETPLTVHVVPFASSAVLRPSGTSIGGQPSILIANSPLYNASTVLKRTFDVVGASLLLALLFPLLAAVAMAIKLESRGPVFFRQIRHGYGNCDFKVFKFRSMRVMEDGAAFKQATRNDPRITRVGHFIRKSNLDELPQLLNVVLGDMSLVGPRPHPVALNDDFAARIRMFNRRHNIRPGITGWAQVNGFRGETDTDFKMMKRIEHDLWYVDHWSFLLDLRILIFTIVSPTAYKNAG